ncbi:hypothetical protein IF188_08270 [Microbacterium sp. NEAU-LLC]|uniref:Uncharacterized protein n=1 Tax=Microbacterium helvum TaxID=2773713 RepID=A0ABR8NML9_9MICO|nr:hypothetical protein [Microbacterium helvum]MBD3941687.1 hypothetical protein [Microbacterium helvum]
MNTNDRAARIAAHRSHIDDAIVARVEAAIAKDAESGIFDRLASASWPEARRVLHARLRRALLDAGLGGGDSGLARVDVAVKRALDAYEAGLVAS